MRAVILLLCLFASVFAFDPQCYSVNLNCAASGAACGLNVDDNAHTVTITDCNTGSYCNQLDQVCTNYLAVGASCSGINAGVCPPGQECSSLMTNSSVCTTIQVVAIGGKCDGLAYYCANNAYCSGGVCAAATAIGADCSTTFNCVPGGTCDSNGGSTTCVAAFSVANGGHCEVDTECTANSYCNIEAANGPVCTANTSPSGKSCTGELDNSTCSYATESCQFNKCSSGTAQYTCQSLYTGYTSTEVKNAQNFYSCQNSNVNDICETSATCTHCKSQACNSFLGDLTYSSKCQSGDCSSAVAVVSSCLFIAAALFVSM